MRAAVKREPRGPDRPSPRSRSGVFLRRRRLPVIPRGFPFVSYFGVSHPAAGGVRDETDSCRPVWHRPCGRRSFLPSRDPAGLARRGGPHGRARTGRHPPSLRGRGPHGLRRLDLQRVFLGRDVDSRLDREARRAAAAREGAPPRDGSGEAPRERAGGPRHRREDVRLRRVASAPERRADVDSPDAGRPRHRGGRPGRRDEPVRLPVPDAARPPPDAPRRRSGHPAARTSSTGSVSRRSSPPTSRPASTASASTSGRRTRTAS